MSVPLQPKKSTFLTLLAFLIPLGIWAAVSYLPFLWHPMVEIDESGGTYFQVGDLVEKVAFAEENLRVGEAGGIVAEGRPTNPVFLPAPHEVGRALVTAFTTPPRRSGDPWLHESLRHSISIIAWGFGISSLIGVPLGILCGTFPTFSKLHEPFVEFFRYLPAPVFGALAVAVLGINDAPKIAIIFIGTFFQQVLVIANTTRRVDPSLIEAAQTLGARRTHILFRVVVPASSVEIYNDLRVLLGWAWTYLIVAELIGRSSGITFFIAQQARYRNYDNVFAAIILIGVIGLATDIFLSRLAKHLFPWKNGKPSALAVYLKSLPATYHPMPATTLKANS